MLRDDCEPFSNKCCRVRRSVVMTERLAMHTDPRAADLPAKPWWLAHPGVPPARALSAGFHRVHLGRQQPLGPEGQRRRDQTRATRGRSTRSRGTRHLRAISRDPLHEVRRALHPVSRKAPVAVLDARAGVGMGVRESHPLYQGTETRQFYWSPRQTAQLPRRLPARHVQPVDSATLTNRSPASANPNRRCPHAAARNPDVQHSSCEVE